MSDPTDTLRERVERAQALAAAATPGPWCSEGDTMTGGMDFRYVMVPLPVGASVASGIIARCPRFGTHAHEAAANADMMAAAPDLVALIGELWAEIERLRDDQRLDEVARKDIGVRLGLQSTHDSPSCLADLEDAIVEARKECDAARRSLAVVQADLAVARAVDAEHSQRAVRAEQERDAALAELTDFMRTVERRRFARQENARYCADRLSSMDADALRDLVAATASELDDAYAAFDQMAASSIRADLQRAEMRAERDAALATVARHRGEAKTPVVAGGRELVWVGVSDGTWHLCWVDDRRWATAPYSAWRRDAVSYACFGAPRAATVQCNDIRTAVCELARMARDGGHTVPPHPLGWDVGVSDG